MEGERSILKYPKTNVEVTWSEKYLKSVHTVFLVLITTLWWIR